MNRVKLDIEQVTSGMKLAEAVVNSAGVTLMPAGIRLTPIMINHLKKWGVASLEVLVEKTSVTRKGESGTTKRVAAAGTGVGLTAEQEEFARAIASEVAGWFVNVRENPLMVQLRNVVIRKLIAHGRDGMINVMRRNESPAAEEGA